jgi:hypothetical protein
MLSIVLGVGDNSTKPTNVELPESPNPNDEYYMRIIVVCGL